MLAGKLGLPRAALEGSAPMPTLPAAVPGTVPFDDPDPFRELRFPSVLAAKLAIADYLGRPLAKLAAEDLAFRLRGITPDEVIELVKSRQELFRLGWLRYRMMAPLCW